MHRSTICHDAAPDFQGGLSPRNNSGFLRCLVGLALQGYRVIESILLFAFLLLMVIPLTAAFLLANFRRSRGQEPGDGLVPRPTAGESICTFQVEQFNPQPATSASATATFRRADTILRPGRISSSYHWN